MINYITLIKLQHVASFSFHLWTLWHKCANYRNSLLEPRLDLKLFQIVDFNLVCTCGLLCNHDSLHRLDHAENLITYNRDAISHNGLSFLKGLKNSWKSILSYSFVHSKFPEIKKFLAKFHEIRKFLKTGISDTSCNKLKQNYELKVRHWQSISQQKKEIHTHTSLRDGTPLFFLLGYGFLPLKSTTMTFIRCINNKTLWSKYTIQQRKTILFFIL